MRKSYWLILIFILLSVNIPTIAQSSDCSGVPSRLVVGQLARVTPGVPNNMRQEPTTSASKIGQIPGEGEFEVLDGPECADGYTWWRVGYNGQVGWTVEGDNTEYWLEPIPRNGIGGGGSQVTNSNSEAELLRGLSWFLGGGGQVPECRGSLETDQVFIGWTRERVNLGETMVVDRFVNSIPEFCVPKSIPTSQLEVIAPSNRVFQPRFVDELAFAPSYRLVLLPVEAYTEFEFGTWRFVFGDSRNWVDLEIVERPQYVGFYDEDLGLDIIIFAGFDPFERIKIIVEQGLVVSVYELQVGELGNRVLDMTDDPPFPGISAVVGESSGYYRPLGKIRGMNYVGQDRSYRIPAESAERILNDILWEGKTVDIATWTCPGASPIRLNSGFARTLDDTVAYSEPNIESEVVASIPQDFVVRKHNGVSCSSEAVWWFVEWRNDENNFWGYMMESEGNGYLLEPVPNATEPDNLLPG